MPFFLEQPQKYTNRTATYSVCSIELLLAFDEFGLLLGEVDELVEGLLVHVAVLLQLRITLIQLLEQLWTPQWYMWGVKTIANSRYTDPAS